METQDHIAKIYLFSNVNLVYRVMVPIAVFNIGTTRCRQDDKDAPVINICALNSEVSVDIC